MTSLNLSENAIEKQGAERIAAALERNNNVTTLDLSRNMIGDQGTAAIAAALERNWTSLPIHPGTHLPIYPCTA